MNFDDLKALVSKGESDRVEFKRSTGQRTAAAKTVCAMLNGLGGFVIFGVNNKGEITGQQVSAKTLEELSNELRKIEPPAFPDIETVHLKGDKAVIIIFVPGGGGPYTFDGRPYIRHGPITTLMPREEYNRRLLERLHATHRFQTVSPSTIWTPRRSKSLWTTPSGSAAWRPLPDGIPNQSFGGWNSSTMESCSTPPSSSTGKRTVSNPSIRSSRSGWHVFAARTVWRILPTIGSTGAMPFRYSAVRNPFLWTMFPLLVESCLER